MSIKIVKAFSADTLLSENTAAVAQPSDVVTLDQINGLCNNLFAKMGIKDSSGTFRNLDSAKDTKTAYFEKAKLDELFAANPGSDGLKIFFGVHDHTIYPNRLPNCYDGKLMVVLVTTTGKTSNLSDDDHVDIAGGGDYGMDNGTLCPPDPGC